MRSAASLAAHARSEQDAWRKTLARVGLVAKGVSYGLVGVLALKLALGDGGKATSRQGALATIAQHAFGKVLLVLLALGFASYAAWRFVDAILGADEDDDAKGWAKRAGYAARGAIYASLTFSTARLLFSAGGSQSQNQKTHKATAQILSWPAGTWIVGIVGAVVIGVGAWNIYRGVAKKFLKHWGENAGESPRAWGTWAGVVGLIARGLVFALIGVFGIKAAVDYNPKEAVGLDGALQKLAGHGYGAFLLGVVAAGLLCYALFCFAEARYRDV